MLTNGPSSHYDHSMNDENCGLTSNEVIGWVMNLFQCSDSDDHDRIVSRLAVLSDDELKVIDSAALVSTDSLRIELASGSDMKDILLACSMVIGNERHRNYSISTVIDVMDALRRNGIGLDFLEVHLRANKRCTFVDSVDMNYEQSVYSNNKALMSLIEEYPDRMEEAMTFRLKRKTNDADLIREYLTLDKPLSDGAL